MKFIIFNLSSQKIVQNQADALLQSAKSLGSLAGNRPKVNRAIGLCEAGKHEHKV